MKMVYILVNINYIRIPSKWKEGYTVGDKIKTALEMAMERLATRKEAEPEELVRLEYLPKGKALAASFFSSEEVHLNDSITSFDKKVVPYILEGVQEVLLANLLLPITEEILQSNKRAMEGLAQIKHNKKQLSGILKEMGFMFAHYRQTLEQAADSLKQEMQREATAQGMSGYPQDMQAMGKQMKYQEEWAMLQRQLDQRYEGSLAEMKRIIREMT